VGKGPRPVRVIETGEEFPNVRTAAAAYGLARHCIYNSIAFGYRTGGVTWEWAHHDAPSRPAHYHRNAPVRCITTGVVYASVKSAARALRISEACIWQQMSRVRRDPNATTHGLQFTYTEEPPCPPASRAPSAV
jgi:hypothetical protein